MGALFKGCLVRACWTAPLGAFNFAGGSCTLSVMNGAGTTCTQDCATLHGSDQH